jgi:hypothetical protein
MLETVFDGWVQEAEKNLLVSGDVPLVDSQEIDMADELRALANRAVTECSGEGWSSSPSDIEAAIEFLENRLIGSHCDLPVRFVILNFLYRLAHSAGFESGACAQALYWEFWPHFGHFAGLHLQEVSVLKDPRAIRWEITNACAIHNWDLATELLDLLKSLRAITVVQYREIKGQMYVCSVAAPKHQEELDEELGAAGRDDMGWWILKLDSAFFPLNQRSRRPVALLAWGMDLADQSKYSAEECERLSDAAHE